VKAHCRGTSLESLRNALSAIKDSEIRAISRSWNRTRSAKAGEAKEGPRGQERQALKRRRMPPAGPWPEEPPLQRASPDEPSTAGTQPPPKGFPQPICQTFHPPDLILHIGKTSRPGDDAPQSLIQRPLTVARPASAVGLADFGGPCWRCWPRKRGAAAQRLELFWQEVEDGSRTAWKTDSDDQRQARRHSSNGPLGARAQSARNGSMDPTRRGGRPHLAAFVGPRLMGSWAPAWQ